MLSGNKWSN